MESLRGSGLYGMRFETRRQALDKVIDWLKTTTTRKDCIQH